MRQLEVRHMYKNTFDKVKKLFWLPTFLTRENPELPILTPEDLIKELENPEIAEPAEMNDALAAKLNEYRDNGYLILMILTGENDNFARETFKD